MPTAREILDHRLVAGEISEEEYRKRLDALMSGAEGASGLGESSQPLPSGHRYSDRTHRSVSFGAAFSLFFANYFRFTGRSSRGAYWWWILWSVILSVLTVVADGVLLVTGAVPAPAQPVNFIFSLVTLIPGISLSVRRLHDVDKSGWWNLLVFTIVGIILLLVWCAQPGIRGRNKYGEDVEAGRE